MRECPAVAAVTAAVWCGGFGDDEVENCTDGRDGNSETDTDTDVGADTDGVGDDGDDAREEEVGCGRGNDDVADGDTGDQDDDTGLVAAASRGSAHSRSDVQSSAERTATGAVWMLLPAASADAASFAGDAGRGDSDDGNDDNDNDDGEDEEEDGIESANSMRCASPFTRGAS